MPLHWSISLAFSHTISHIIHSLSGAAELSLPILLSISHHHGMSNRIQPRMHSHSSSPNLFLLHSFLIPAMTSPQSSCSSFLFYSLYLFLHYSLCGPYKVLYTLIAIYFSTIAPIKQLFSEFSSLHVLLKYCLVPSRHTYKKMGKCPI